MVRANGAKMLQRAGWGLLLAMLTLALLQPGLVRGQEVEYYLMAKRGTQDASGSNETLFDDLEKDHGELKDERSVQTNGLELDVFGFIGPSSGIGLGLEGHQYVANFRFRDPSGLLPTEDLHIQGRGMLYTLKAFARWGALHPFIGFGSGNYYMAFVLKDEDLSFLDSAPQVFTSRVGFRLLLGGWAILYEAGNTTAPITVRTSQRTSTLELGGTYQTLGLGLAW